jgi:APA family basic amino acid/polyamine antiporter
MCSGITSASTASRFFASNFFKGFGFDWGTGGIVAVALLFMAIVAAVNLRGVGESVKLNVVLTIVEITGQMLVIFVSFWAFTQGGDVDFSRVVAFDTAEDKNAFLAVTTATSLACFAMVGFEDSVNMAEETKDPVKTFPKMLLTGLGIAGVVSIIVAVVAVALVPVGTLEASETPLVEVVKAAAPGLPIEQILPFISMFAVANTALINMLMAQSPDLRHGQAARPAAGARHRASLAPDPVGRHIVHHRNRFRAHPVRHGVRGRLRDLHPWRDHVALAARGIRSRERRRAGAAQGRPRRRGALQDADVAAHRGIRGVAISGVTAVRSAAEAVRAIALVILGIVLFGITLAINRAVGIRGSGITVVEKLDAEP